MIKLKKLVILIGIFSVLGVVVGCSQNTTKENSMRNLLNDGAESFSKSVTQKVTVGLIPDKMVKGFE